MKSKMKRRMLAIVLCMVIVLSNSSFIFASSESGTPAVEAASTEGTTSQTETDTQGTETTPQTLAVSESTPAPTDESAAPTSVEATPTPTDTPEVTMTPEPTGTPTPEATPTPTDTPQPTDTPETTTTPEPTDTPEPTTTPEPTDTPEATPTPTQGAEDGTSDTAQPTAAPTPTEAPVKSNEAVELKQEFKDSDGNVTSTVKAQIPEGTFAADASEITMEVRTPDTASAEHVKEMMEELLPENHMLGDYIFYDIQFKVNGTVTEPQKPITITFEGEKLSVKDVKRANVFWLDPEDPQVDGDKDQLVEITQKSEMIENLQNSGQSTEHIDDYDLSEITLKEDGISDKIQMEGRTSTIYGCYVEKLSEEKTMTQKVGDITVSVKAPEGAFSVNSDLVTMTADPLTEEQKELVEEQLQKQADAEGMEVREYVAYDINLWADGKKIQPQIPVTVTFENTGLESCDADNTTGFQVDETSKQITIIGEISQTEEKVEVTAEHFTITGAYIAVGNTPVALETDNNESLAESYWPTAENTNEWQIVRENFKTDGKSSQPYFPNENNTDVRIQKNILPTEKENEFYIYLNVEPQLSWEEIFEMASIWVFNSDSTHDQVFGPGEIPEDADADWIREHIGSAGANSHVSNLVKDPDLIDSTKEKEPDSVDVEYIIKNEDGTTDVFKISNLWYSIPSGQIGSVLIRLPFQDHYTQLGVNVIDGVLKIEIDENFFFQNTGDYVLRDDKIDLDSVTDPMGDYINYVENKKVTNGSQAYPTATGEEITWSFPDNKELPTDFQDYEIVTLSDGTKTVYWKYAYELVYKITLDTEADGFSFGKVYDTNKETILKYDTEEEKEKEANFRIPAVKSREFMFQKTDQDGNALPGAEFSLYRKNGDTIEEEAAYTAISASDGTVAFQNVEPGTYIMKETKVPEGYVQADITWTYTVGDDGTVELRDEFGNLLTAASGNEYPQIKNYQITDSNLGVEKTAQVIDWGNRTYRIDLSAGHNISIEWPKDIVLVLDVSGSMAWMLDAPSSKRQYLNELEKDSTYRQYIEQDQELIKDDGAPAVASNYNKFHFYIQDGADYKPIVKSLNSDSWYTVAANGQQRIAIDSIITNNPKVYVVNNSTERSTKTKIEALQEAVTAFVENVAAISPDSKLSVVTFAGEINYSGNMQNAAELVDEISDLFENEIRLEGGTRQDLGLEEAYQKLQNSERESKAVVLFTDGAPNGVSAEVVNSSADRIKTMADLFAIGLYDENTANAQTQNMQMWASKPSDKYCFISTDTESLMNQFAEMLANMNIGITGATIKDYIDNRFIVTDSEGNALEVGATIGDGGVLKYDDAKKLYYVEWTDQVISYSADLKSGWNQTIYIKAKPEYIGGNDVKTNESGSGLTVSGITKDFGFPTVNVKVDFNIGKDEDTIYLGDSLEDFFTETVQKAIEKTQSVTGTDYTNFEDVNGPVIKWYDQNNKEITPEEIRSASPSTDTVYHVVVKYTPKTNGTQSKDNMENPNGEYYRVDPDGVAKEGTYTVKVISGQINITKKLDNVCGSDKIFTFVVTKDGNEYGRYKITVSEGNSQGNNMTPLENAGSLTDMPRGIYSITEEVTDGYEIQSVSIGNGTDCYSDKGTNSASFVLGNNTNNENVITEDGKYTSGGRLGEVIFTNKQVLASNWQFVKKSSSPTNPVQDGAEFEVFSSPDGEEPIYYGKSDEEGIIKWYEDAGRTKEIEKLPKGTYELRETKAPLGFAVSNEVWTFSVTESGALGAISSNSGEITSVEEPDETISYCFFNTPVFDLPSAGSSGIFGYTMGGTLLLMAGTLILYKMKRKEVQES